MAITVTNVTSGSSTTTTANTSSFTTVTGDYYILTIVSYSAVDINTASNSLGLTWTKPTSLQGSFVETTGQQNFMVFYAKCTLGSTGTVAISNTWNSGTFKGMTWNIDRVQGIDSIGNTNLVKAVDPVTSGTLTGALTFASTSSGVYSMWSTQAPSALPTTSLESGYTQVMVKSASWTGHYDQVKTAYKPSNDTTPSVTYSASSGSIMAAGISLELKPLANTIDTETLTYSVSNQLVQVAGSAYYIGIDVASYSVTPLTATTSLGTISFTNISNGYSANTYDIVPTFSVTADQVFLAIIGSKYTGSLPSFIANVRISWTFLESAITRNGAQYAFYKGIAISSGTVVNMQADYGAQGGFWSIDVVSGINANLYTKVYRSAKTGFDYVSPTTITQTELGGAPYVVALSNSAAGYNPPEFSVPAGYTACSGGTAIPQSINRLSVYKTPYSSSTTVQWLDFLNSNPEVRLFAVTLGADTTIGLDPISFTLTNNSPEIATLIDVNTFQLNISNKLVAVDKYVGVELLNYTITNPDCQVNAQKWIPVEVQTYSITNIQVQKDQQLVIPVSFNSFFVQTKDITNESQTWVQISPISYSVTNSYVIIDKLIEPDTQTFTISNKIVDRQVSLLLPSYQYTVTNQDPTFIYLFGIDPINYSITNQQVLKDEQKWIGVDLRTYQITNLDLQVNAIKNIGVDLWGYQVTDIDTDFGLSLAIPAIAYSIINIPPEVIGNRIFININETSFNITTNDAQSDARVNIPTDQISFLIDVDELQIQQNKNISVDSNSVNVTTNDAKLIGNVRIEVQPASFVLTNIELKVVSVEVIIDIDPVYYYLSTLDTQIDASTEIGIEEGSYTLANYEVEYGTVFVIDQYDYTITNQPVTVDGTTILGINPEIFIYATLPVTYAIAISVSTSQYNIINLPVQNDSPISIWVNARNYRVTNQTVQVNSEKNIGISQFSINTSLLPVQVNPTRRILVSSALYQISSADHQVDENKNIVVNRTSFTYRFRTVQDNATTEIDVLPVVYLVTPQDLGIELRTSISVSAISYTVENEPVVKEIQKAINISTAHINITDLELLIAPNWLADTYIDIDVGKYQCTNDPLFIAALDEYSYPEYRIYVDL